MFRKRKEKIKKKEKSGIAHGVRQDRQTTAGKVTVVAFIVFRSMENKLFYSRSFFKREKIKKKETKKQIRIAHVVRHERQATAYS